MLVNQSVDGNLNDLREDLGVRREDLVTQTTKKEVFKLEMSSLLITTFEIQKIMS